MSKFKNSEYIVLLYENSNEDYFLDKDFFEKYKYSSIPVNIILMFEVKSMKIFQFNLDKNQLEYFIKKYGKENIENNVFYVDIPNDSAKIKYFFQTLSPSESKFDPFVENHLPYGKYLLLLSPSSNLINK